MTFALRFAARSDVGLVRADNQDSGYAGPDLLVVADGMGGHAGGDVASTIAVASLAPLDGRLHAPENGPDELEAAIESARESIVARSAAQPELAGMGTTVTALLRAGDMLVMAHLGDSRAYLLHDDELAQITTDHTFVQHLVDTGRIAPEEAEHHPQRNVVMRVLGDFEVDLTPDLSVREAHVGDRWLLCSDGLSGFVGADTIAQILISVTDPGDCAETLIQLALRAGSTDNVTCVVADVIAAGAPATHAPASDDEDTASDADAPAIADAPVDVPASGAETVALSTAADVPELPAQRAEIVGSAARDLEIVDALDTSATAPPADPDDAASREDAAPEGSDADGADADRAQGEAPTGHRRLLGVGATLLVLILLLAGGYAAYGWTQDQYYVGESDGQVAVFRGVPQGIGPLTLSTPVELTGVQVSTLPPYVADRLEQTIPASSLADAENIAREVVAGTVPTPGATESPTAEPTAEPTAAPSTTATPAPAATPHPSTSTKAPHATTHAAAMSGDGSR